MLFTDGLIGEARNTLRQVAKRHGVKLRQLEAQHRGFANALDPDFSGAVGTDLDDAIIPEPGEERFERLIEKDGIYRDHVHA